jgi:hypothetical protein
MPDPMTTTESWWWVQLGAVAGVASSTRGLAGDVHALVDRVDTDMRGLGAGRSESCCGVCIFAAVCCTQFTCVRNNDDTSELRLYLSKG